ncbi:MAG: Wzz/FepE/Etk N-terminal domain-containing protein, partial [Nitrospinota bacterium]
MEHGNKNIYEQLMIFYRRKWMLIIPVFIGITLASLVAYLLPSYYRSTTLILVEAQQIPEAYVKSTNMSPIEEQLNTIKQQVMSRTKLEEVIDSLNLYKEDSNKKRWNRLLKIIGIEQIGISTKEDKVEMMRKDIEVNIIDNAIGRIKKGGGADAFSISYTSTDPKIAMHVTSNLASFFIDENLKIREQYSEGTSEFLSSELEKAENELKEQEKKIKDFKEKNIGVLPEQLEANLRTLDRLQMELQNIQSTLKNAEDKKLFMEGQIGNLTNLEVTEKKLLQGELLKLKSELSSLLTIYKETFP